MDSVYTTSELLDDIKTELCHNFDDIKLFGEVSCIKQNNHIYFTLTDGETNVNCIIWHNNSIYDKAVCEITNGREVKVVGKLNIYAKSCQINFIVNEFEIHGQGSNSIKSDKVYNNFNERGYFSRKKAIPSNIMSIGVLTSMNGAVIQDILCVLKSKGYNGLIQIHDCITQGTKCAQSIIDGISYFEKNYNAIDVLLIARGGGSKDDLCGFNDVMLVEKIYASQLYIMSAVGHETDTTLCDHVANYRASTPSIAAEKISESHTIYKNMLKQTLNEIDMTCSTIESNTMKKIQTFTDTLQNIDYGCDAEFIDKYICGMISDLKATTQNALKTIKKEIDENKPQYIESYTELNACVLGSFTDEKEHINVCMNGRIYKIKYVIESITTI